MDKRELAVFLPSRRERIRPTDVGLPAGPRRHPASAGPPTQSAAFVTSADFEVLAWNHLAAALMEDFSALPPHGRKFARRVFLDAPGLDWLVVTGLTQDRPSSP